MLRIKAKNLSLPVKVDRSCLKMSQNLGLYFSHVCLFSALHGYSVGYSLNMYISTILVFFFQLSHCTRPNCPAFNEVETRQRNFQLNCLHRLMGSKQLFTALLIVVNFRSSCGHTTDFYLGKTDLPRANSSKISQGPEGKFISGFVLLRHS